jgi:hypothetical protein
LITAYLFDAGGHENPSVLKTNAGKSFIGSYVLGMGFTFDDTDSKGIASPVAEMEKLISENPRNAERIFPYIGGDEVNDSPTHAHVRYVINFADFPLRRDRLENESWLLADEKRRDNWLRAGVVPLDYPGPVAADLPDLLAIVETKVKPHRMTQGSIVNPMRWYRFARPASDLQTAIATLGIDRVMVLSRVRATGFTFLPVRMVFSEQLVVFALSTYASFALLQSRIHELWAHFFSGSALDLIRYAPTDCFETFPFPVGWEANSALEFAGNSYYDFRAALMVRNDEGLTKIYNRFHDPDEASEDIEKLRELHAAMDVAVLRAYSWEDIIPRCEYKFLLDYEDEDDDDGKVRKRKKPYRYRWPDEVRDEVLARLLQLNAERAEEERVLGTTKGRSKNSAKRPTRPTEEPTLI